MPQTRSQNKRRSPKPVSARARQLSTASRKRRVVRNPTLTPAKRGVIAARLARELEESDFTQTHLARLLAGFDAPERKVEGTRRLILKWLSGTNPGVDYARQLSEIFGKEADYFLVVPATHTEHEAVEFARATAETIRGRNGAETLSGPLDRTMIHRLFPHFNEDHVFIDLVDVLEPARHVRARRLKADPKWPPRSFYLTADLIPGFVLAEALAQTGAIALLAEPENRDRIVLCAAFNGLRFKRVVHADDEVVLEAWVTRRTGQLAQVDVKASVQDLTAVQGRLTLAIS